VTSASVDLMRCIVQCCFSRLKEARLISVKRRDEWESGDCVVRLLQTTKYFHSLLTFKFKVNAVVVGGGAYRAYKGDILVIFKDISRHGPTLASKLVHCAIILTVGGIEKIPTHRFEFCHNDFDVDEGRLGDKIAV